MPRTKHTRVLVVDDYEDAADSLALLLGLWGYDSEVCYDGPSALETARAYRPQVALLDVAIPRMDGFEVARRLRSVPQLARTVLIAISGYGRESDISRARAVGFSYYLLKPVEPEDLRELMGRVASRAANLQRGGWPRAAVDKSRGEREFVKAIW
jgi:two-component system CheB/CheR fusion protein